MWREQPPGADMFLGKVIGKRLGVETKMAQRRREGNKERSVGRKV